MMPAGVLSAVMVVELKSGGGRVVSVCTGSGWDSGDVTFEVEVLILIVE